MPSKHDPDFLIWKSVNNMVLSWLTNTIHIDLIPTTITTQSPAAELWSYLIDGLSMDDNIIFFNLQRDASTLKQGNDSLLVYFKKSTKIWNDLSFFFHKFSCSCGNNNHQVHQLMYFLMGLHENYAWFRRQILSTYPILQVDEVYDLILQVDRTHTELEKSHEENHIENAIKNDDPDVAFYNVDAINNWHCAYCHKSGHTIDLCYNLHGYPSYPQVNKTEVKLFTHHHPLKFSMEINDNVAYCSGCGLILVGPNYGCTYCNFVLHEFCTEITSKTMYYPGHPQHNLSFLMASVYDGGIFKCDDCGNIGHGFHFHCSICSYDLHLHCAMLPHILEHDSHPHQLNLQPCKGSVPTYCDACSGVCSTMTYSCIRCQFFLHPSCASLPRDISCGENSQFTLSLPYSNRPSHIRCNFCDRIPNQQNWIYSCKESRIFTHLDCGALQALAPHLLFNDLKNYGKGFEEYVSLHVKGVHMQKMRLQQQSSSKIDCRNSIKEQEIRKAGNLELDQLEKHKHKMVLITDSIPTNSNDLCTWCHQLLSGTIYGCYQCKFFVHKICQETPRTLTHHFHLHHSLILLPRIRRPRKWCTACDNLITGTVFCCKPCDLFLHPECALLPQETRYEHHFHKIFNLIYEIEGEVSESDEYYCNVCEKRLYEKWAYKCAHCEYIAHLACMVPSALPSRNNDGKEEMHRNKSKQASEPNKIS